MNAFHPYTQYLRSQNNNLNRKYTGVILENLLHSKTPKSVYESPWLSFSLWSIHGWLGFWEGLYHTQLPKKFLPLLSTRVKKRNYLNMVCFLWTRLSLDTCCWILQHEGQTVDIRITHKSSELGTSGYNLSGLWCVWHRTSSTKSVASGLFLSRARARRCISHAQPKMAGGRLVGCGGKEKQTSPLDGCSCSVMPSALNYICTVSCFIYTGWSNLKSYSERTIIFLLWLEIFKKSNFRSPGTF